MKKRIQKQLKNLPQKPGVYLFSARGRDAAGRILYIGKAVNLKKRVSSHFSRNAAGAFKSYLLPQIADIDFIKTDNAREALILENQLIKKYQPRFNIQWRDDKSYFGVEITGDEWPRVKIVHQPPTKNRRLKTDFIGPFTNATELKEVLRALRKILPFRTCKNPYGKPCLQWHLGLCPAHGVANGKSLIAYSKTKENYLNLLNTLSQILRLYAGQSLRIEAYDISNIQGTFATGSMVVFRGLKPKKSDYRRFKIKTVRGANDVAMIKEILKRRFNHPEWPQPDLILIDGGRAQLNAARQIVNSKWQISPRLTRLGRVANSKRPLAILALAKREDKFYTEFSDKGLKLEKLPPFLRLFFQALRDEAHRFAIGYYRKLHRKTIKD